MSWNKSPISTLIETKPIEELKFPKVMVCPPQDTYTTLNYDLQKLDGVEMDDAARKELFNLVFMLYHEFHVNDTIESLDFLIEENRFQNWYKGITKVTVPPPMNLMKSWNETQFNINTSFSSGSIQTIGFRQPFEATNFVHNLNLSIKIVFEYNLDAKNRESISSRRKRETKGFSKEGAIRDKVEISKNWTEKKNWTEARRMNIKIHQVSLDRSPLFQILLVDEKEIENETTEIQKDCKVVHGRCELEIKLLRKNKDLDFPLNEMPGFKLEWDFADNSTKETVTDFSR